VPLLVPAAPRALAQEGPRVPPDSRPDRHGDEAPVNEFAGLVRTLLAEYFYRHPDQAVQRRWPQARKLSLGTFGTEASVRWRDALQRGRGRLRSLSPPVDALLAEAQYAALDGFLQAGLLLLETQAKERTDPTGYVGRAGRLLQALNEAPWLSPRERSERVLAVLEELPAYWLDARLSLVAPVPDWIDAALLDLDDLVELLQAVTAALELATVEPERFARATQRALEATGGFRRFLLEIRPSAGKPAPVLGEADWLQLVRSVSGTGLSLGELKAAALRDLAEPDETSRAEARPLPPALEPKLVAANVWNASSRTVALAHAAELIAFPLRPTNFEVATEASPRTREEIVWLRAGAIGCIRAFIELPSPLWPQTMKKTRISCLQPACQVALGVRHGLAGEAMFAFRARGSRRPLAAFLQNRPVLEGVGLYALDWVPRVDWVEQNPYRDDPVLRAEFERMRGFEAARFLAALELHAEGISLSGASAAFARRTGVDAETALAEARSALRDPLAGIGHLGALELRALEDELAPLLTPARALSLTLRLTTTFPEVRTADLRAVVRDRFQR
jgi:hypothetical protein